MANRSCYRQKIKFKQMKQLIYIICCFCAVSNYAQVTEVSVGAAFDLPQVAMLVLEPNGATVTLEVGPPIEAGEKAIIKKADKDIWIRFSSAVIEGNTRHIEIGIETGQQLPPGINLKLSTAKGSGIGAIGDPAGDVTLSTSSQSIITGIGGAYTGNGAGSGYKLSYYLVISDYKLLEFDPSANLTINLTFMD